MTRRDRLIREREHDPYKSRGKLPDPTACTGCGAMYRAGRWQWGAPPADANRVLCPACQRARDGYPAGVLTVRGEFAMQHREEVLNLARNVEERENKQHPLKRIMEIREDEDEFSIATTDAGLARSVGDALHHAYAGSLDVHYAEEGVRVRWER